MSRDDAPPAGARDHAFARFEPAPLEELLRDVAHALRVRPESLRADDPLDDGKGSLERLSDRLEMRGVSVDMSRAHTVRQLAGLLVPLRESDPTAHH